MKSRAHGRVRSRYGAKARGLLGAAYEGGAAFFKFALSTLVSPKMWAMRALGDRRWKCASSRSA